MAKKEEKISIEVGLLRLDEILSKMEEKDTDLNTSFTLYEEGMKLLMDVNNQIDEVEKKVLVIKEDGSLAEFDEGEEQ